MSLGQGRIERERHFGRCQARLVRSPPDTQSRLANGYQYPGAGILRIDLQRALSESDSDLQVLRAKVAEVIPALQIDLVGCGIARRARLNCLPLGRQQADLQRSDD